MTPLLQSMECMHVRINRGSLPAIGLLVIYRKGNIAFLTFIDELTTLLENIVSNTGNLYLVGDFNIKLSRYPNAQTFQDFLECFSFQNHVKFSTHLSGNTLYLVISKNDDSSITNLSRSDMLADHFAAEFNLKYTVHKKPSQTRLEV